MNLSKQLGRIKHLIQHIIHYLISFLSFLFSFCHLTSSTVHWESLLLEGLGQRPLFLHFSSFIREPWLRLTTLPHTSPNDISALSWMPSPGLHPWTDLLKTHLLLYSLSLCGYGTISVSIRTFWNSHPEERVCSNPCLSLSRAQSWGTSYGSFISVVATRNHVIFPLHMLLHNGVTLIVCICGFLPSLHNHVQL